MKITAKGISTMIVVICAANWFAWGVICGFLLGDGFNSKVEGDKYFISSHGRYTQVSRDVYIYTRIHGYTAFGGLAVMLLVAVASTATSDDKKPDEPAA